MGSEFKRWTAKHKDTLMKGIIRSGSMVAEAFCALDLTVSVIEASRYEAERGVQNALLPMPPGIREDYEKLLEELQEVYREAVVELSARKSCRLLWVST